MHGRTAAAFAFVALSGLLPGLVPGSLSAQFVLRDDVDGWAWLARVADRDAVVQMVKGSPQTGDQERLDRRLLEELRGAGVRRVWEIGAFDAAESYVVGECASVSWPAEGDGAANVGVHAEVSFWDHTRLSATEIFESLTFRSLGVDDPVDDIVMRTCVTQLVNVLFRLGFNRG